MSLPMLVHSLPLRSPAVPLAVAGLSASLVAAALATTHASPAPHLSLVAAALLFLLFLVWVGVCFLVGGVAERFLSGGGGWPGVLPPAIRERRLMGVPRSEALTVFGIIAPFLNALSMIGMHLVLPELVRCAPTPPSEETSFLVTPMHGSPFFATPSEHLGLQLMEVISLQATLLALGWMCLGCGYLLILQWRRRRGAAAGTKRRRFGADDITETPVVVSAQDGARTAPAQVSMLTRREAAFRDALAKANKRHGKALRRLSG